MQIVLISAILLVLIDASFISLTVGYYQKLIERVQGSPLKLNFVAAILTYIFLIFGINYFILSKNRSVYEAFLLGSVIYSLYAFTNLALLKDWSVLVAITDTLWGGILFAMTTFIVYKLKKVFHM